MVAEENTNPKLFQFISLYLENGGWPTQYYLQNPN